MSADARFDVWPDGWKDARVRAGQFEHGRRLGASRPPPATAATPSPAGRSRDLPDAGPARRWIAGMASPATPDGRFEQAAHVVTPG
jgi:hypothetical protein